jgi:hypothetical protein
MVLQAAPAKPEQCWLHYGRLMIPATSQLMKEFYKNLSTGTMSKAEALQQAQPTLMGAEARVAKQIRGDSFKLPISDGSTPSK